MSLSVTLDQHPSHWLVTLVGDLDYGECSLFRAGVDRVLSAQPPAVILDLSKLDYLDSSGLGLLLALSKEYGARGGRLVLVSNETVDNILALTRLNGIFSSVGTPSEALAIIAEVPVE